MNKPHQWINKTKYTHKHIRVVLSVCVGTKYQGKSNMVSVKHATMHSAVQVNIKITV